MPLPATVLSKYFNPVFIETGTLLGSSVKLAVALGFEKVYSSDISAQGIRKVRKRYVSDPHVHVTCESSVCMLSRILPKINQDITFWLDAHPAGKLSLNDKGPLLEELRCIHRYARPGNHVLLIDDMRLFSKSDVLKLQQILRRHWPDHTFFREDSSKVLQDILGCKVRRSG